MSRWKYWVTLFERTRRTFSSSYTQPPFHRIHNQRRLLFFRIEQTDFLSLLDLIVFCSLMRHADANEKCKSLDWRFLVCWRMTRVLSVRIDRIHMQCIYNIQPRERGINSNWSALRAEISSAASRNLASCSSISLGWERDLQIFSSHQKWLCQTSKVTPRLIRLQNWMPSVQVSLHSLSKSLAQCQAW